MQRPFVDDCTGLRPCGPVHTIEALWTSGRDSGIMDNWARKLEKAREKFKMYSRKFGEAKIGQQQQHTECVLQLLLPKAPTKELNKDKRSQQVQQSALNMVMLKEGEQARQLDEKLDSGAMKQHSAFHMVMLNED